MWSWSRFTTNRTVSKAEEMAKPFGVPRVHASEGRTGFLWHHHRSRGPPPLDYLAAKHKVPVICQKPMGSDYETCQKMVETCREAGVPFMIHENLPWQTPIRAVKRIIDHTADDKVGEDVATVVLRFGDVTCTCKVSNATHNEWDAIFPASILVEGTQGTLEMRRDYWIRIATEEGLQAHRYVPPVYQWADNQTAWHSSIVDCNADLPRALKYRTASRDQRPG